VSDIRGAVVGVLVIVSGVIGLLYVVVDALKEKPGALAIVIFFILLPTSAWAVFNAIQLARQHRGTTRAPDIIDAVPRQLPQLSEPSRFVRTEPNVFISRDVLMSDATKILGLKAAGWPAPRRALCEHVLQTNDHERVSRALNYLASCGYVTAAESGVSREWVGDE
jgi:hypothetical protein